MFYAIPSRTIAKRCRSIESWLCNGAGRVPRLKNDLAPLQKAFTGLKNDFAMMRKYFSAPFHTIAPLQTLIAKLEHSFHTL